MIKKFLPVIFIIVCIIGIIIANLYNTGNLSIGWAYFGIVLAYIAVGIAIYGFITQTIPKFKSIYKRWFKKEETKTGISKENKQYRRKRRKYIN